MKKLGKIAILGTLVGTLSGCGYKVPTNKIPLPGEVNFWGQPTKYILDNNNDGKVDFIYKVLRDAPDEILFISPKYIPKDGRYLPKTDELKITLKTRIMTPEVQELADSILSLEKRLIAKTDSVFSVKKGRWSLYEI